VYQGRSRLRGAFGSLDTQPVCAKSPIIPGR
jgi:hypothetical protein